MSNFNIQPVVDAVLSVVAHRGRVTLHEPELTGLEAEYVTRCIKDGWVSYLGEFVDRFERDLASVTGARHALVTVNGTAALQVAVIAAGVKPGDEVLVPSLTFVATANAVSHAGAVPHFVDSELATLGVDPDKLEAHLENIAVVEGDVCRNRETGRAIVAIVPVHVFGHPARMREIGRVAQRFHLIVIEDAAEALGSRFHNAHVGGDGLMSVLSFNGNKIVTTGGGGAILTNDSALAARLKHLTTTAKKPHPYRFDHDEIGFNYRMPNVNAAIGCAQLERLDDFVTRKRLLATRYAAALAEVEGISFFSEPEGATSNYWLNALLLDEAVAARKEDVIEALIALGIHCRPVWTPMHRLAMYADCPRMDLSVSEQIERRLINLPSSPALAGN